MKHGLRHRAGSRVSKGLRRAWRNLLQRRSRRRDRPPELRSRVERVTGIEPAWPAWKAGRCEHIGAGQGHYWAARTPARDLSMTYSLGGRVFSASDASSMEPEAALSVASR